MGVQYEAWVLSGTYDDEIEFTDTDTWTYTQKLNGEVISSGEAHLEVFPGEGYELSATLSDETICVVAQTIDGSTKIWQNIICSSDEPEPANPNYVVTFTKVEE